MDDKAHWERVYTSKSAREVSWYQPHADQSLALIQRVGSASPCRVIDVGGGASTLVDDLLALGGFEVSVLDISEAALKVSKDRLGPSQQQVRWLVGDIATIELPRAAYDVWHDRAVFHFMTTARERAAYVAQVRRAVRPGGHVIVAAFGPEGPLQCSGLPVMRYKPDALHAEFGSAFELVEHKTENHRTPSGRLQQFVYCHCLMH